jgi:hypothetical protein
MSLPSTVFPLVRCKVPEMFLKLFGDSKDDADLHDAKIKDTKKIRGNSGFINNSFGVRRYNFAKQMNLYAHRTGSLPTDC